MKTNARERARRALLSYISEHAKSPRREILDGALYAFGLSEGEIAEKNQNGKYGTARSYLGATLSDMIRSGDIERAGNGYVLLRDDAVIVKEDEAERKIRASLSTRPRSKGDLVRLLETIFGTRDTVSKDDDKALQEIVERLLVRLQDEGEIVFEGRKYFLVPKLVCLL